METIVLTFYHKKMGTVGDGVLLYNHKRLIDLFYYAVIEDLSGQALLPYPALIQKDQLIAIFGGEVQVMQYRHHGQSRIIIESF